MKAEETDMTASKACMYGGLLCGTNQGQHEGASWQPWQPCRAGNGTRVPSTHERHAWRLSQAHTS